MIEFQNIKKTFRDDFWSEEKTVLNELTFNIKKGSLTGFLGANGAGKTTLLKILFKFINQDSGNISYSKELGNNWTEIRKKIGYFPERPYFYPDLTGLEFISFMSELGDKKLGVEKRIKDLSEKLLIDHALNNKTKTYSKGMLQRLGFLTAILSEPRFLVLDEPLSGLDPVGRMFFKELMLELHQKGTTIFFSSHIVSDVEEICDNLIVIQKGNLLYEGSLEKLIDENQTGLCEVICKRSSHNFTGFKKKEVLPNGNERYLLDVESKNALIKTIIDENLELVSFKELRPSLEKIIYNTESK